jgi:hypothetical protein
MAMEAIIAIGTYIKFVSAQKLYMSATVAPKPDSAAGN